MYVFVKTAELRPFLENPKHTGPNVSENLFAYHLSPITKFVCILDEQTSYIAFEPEHEERVIALLDIYALRWFRTDPSLN